MARSTTSTEGEKPDTEKAGLTSTAGPDLEAQQHGGEPGPSPDAGGGPPLQKMTTEEQAYKPKTLKFWIIMLSNFLALFLVALDRTIVATAVPRITDAFNSQGDIGWYASAYMLTSASSQLLFGRIYKFYDLKWYESPAALK